MAPEFATRVRFAKVNTEAEQFLAQQYQIRSIPTLALFQKGVELNANIDSRFLVHQIPIENSFSAFASPGFYEWILDDSS